SQLQESNFAQVKDPNIAERRQDLLWFSSQIIQFDDVLKLDLARLTPLGDGISAKLAVGISQTFQAATAIHAFSSRQDCLVSDPEVQKQYAAHAHVWLHGGNSILREGFEALSTVSDKYFRTAFKRA